MVNSHFSKAYLYKRIVDAKLFIDRNFRDSIDVAKLANEACFSKFHFLRLFKTTYGKTPHQYLTTLRIEEAKILLSTQGILVSEVCSILNFESVTSFSKFFKKHTRMTPIEYAKKQQSRQANMKREPLHYVPSCFSEKFGWRNSNFG